MERRIFHLSQKTKKQFKTSRLQFTEEERADPTLEKPIAKSEKAADRLEKAQANIPKKTVKTKERTFDAETGKAKVRLHFEEVDKPKPSSKLTHGIKKAPQRAALSAVHKKISEDEQDNVGLEAAHSTEKAGEFTVRRVQSAYHSHKLKPYRNLAKDEKKSIQADVNVLYAKSLRDNPQSASNPISRFQQKRAIKKQYIATRYGKGAKTAQTTATTAKSAVKKGADTVSKAAAAITKNPKVLFIILALLLLIVVISSAVSSCSVMFQGAISNVVSTSYTSENEELISANDDYTSLETALQAQIDSIERDYPDYDEYRYDLATIGHDPHQLASYLTALKQYFTASEVQGELQRVFEKQYKLTLTETVEVRYRTETRTDSWTDEDGTSHSDTYTVEVPYDYYILNVKLTNNSINTVANSLLTAEQLQMYNVYLQTKGNKPLLFGGGSIDGSPSTDLSGVDFVNGERQGNQNTVDIALSQVGNVGGQPYWSWYGFNSRVEWCACYVSWVLNQAGYGEPKFAACQSQGVPYFSSNGRWASRGYGDIAPGDVIFFDWEGDGHSDHVGIVIGTDGSRVYTVEGNSGDACKVRDYDLNSSVIMGYGLMN
ncbi:C40 family peptidase [Anaerosporobacter mobilis]|uniref:C40 family peptidase n=1 Tax=Anaerosporobacter mobilis TaxID=264463 RepID=UPI000933C91A|nr:CHAP domain-containing protein [Anaerosporobacter mobilis]